MRTKRLQERFGPEYSRTVDEIGDQRAAENELAARVRKRNELDIVALSPEARDKYASAWRTVQSAFVDDPASALGEADRLVTRVMRDRGYPIDDFDQRAAEISVDHPQVVENYRTAHRIFLAQQPTADERSREEETTADERSREDESTDVGTEDQRTAFVHYRALFEALLEPDHGDGETHQHTQKAKEARA